MTYPILFSLMSFLDWFRRRQAIDLSCWLDEGSRMRGFTQSVEDDMTCGEHVLVVGNFADALLMAGKELAVAGISFTTKNRWTPADTQELLMRGPGSVTVVRSTSLPDFPEGMSKVSPAPELPTISLRMCDLHLLPDENDRVRRFAESLPARTKLTAFVSFDDPIMSAFATPWVKLMISRMGLKENEAIDSPMVSKGVHQALRKLAKKATGNIQCDSQRAWMDRNLAT
ncbi:MAG: hypothetical protein ACI9SE_001351 [Neolewinella sp.]|jgi:hypothetical protein